ncbi:MAG: 16S rRNA processing protein RimM [Chloracidobacterium sp.]|nr:16S rRNA processing protein RimM [Chloracidobacterium sp.]
MNEELVAIAKIARTRGLKGEVVADILTDFPDRFEGLEEVTALRPNGSRRALKIESFFFQKDRIVLKFVGIDSIDAGDELRDAEICIDESDAVELRDDEYFDWQIQGCEVETVEGVNIGKVREVMRTGGTEVLLIDGSSRELMIPFAESICIEVDVDKKRIVVDPPQGLLEF